MQLPDYLLNTHYQFYMEKDVMEKEHLWRFLNCVLGDLQGPIQAEMLLSQARSRSSGGPSPDIMALRGRRIAWASETDEGRKMDIGKMKWLVGGDYPCGKKPIL